MMPLTGRRISRKGIAAVAGTLLIGLFGVETDLHRRARAAIRVHQSDVAELRDAAREEWRRRPPVLDPGASQGVPVDLREAILSSDSQVPPEGSEDPLRESRWINRVTQALRSNPLEVRFNPRHPDRESESDARQKVLFRKGCVDFASTLSRVASAHAAGGRDADAVRSIEVILVLARDLSLDPLQEPMLSLWCQETGLRALGDLLTGTGLAAEELKRLAASLEGLRGSTRSFARQWALQFAAYRAQVHSGLSVGLFEFFPSVNGIGVVGRWRDGFLGSVKIAHALRTLKEAEGLLLSAEGRPQSARPGLEIPVYRLLDNGNDLLNGYSPDQLHFTMFDSLEPMVGSLWSLARIAVAAGRYYGAESHWPSRANDLVPAYLPEIPCDAFTGRPLQLAGNRISSPGSQGSEIVWELRPPRK